MHISSKNTLIDFLAGHSPRKVLDAPSGNGWLGTALGGRARIDGIDLFEDIPPGYTEFWKYDLDAGIPPECGGYDLVCSCEGLEHVGNPLLLLKSFHRALKKNGCLIITTPNVWYPQSRLQFLIRGFFPSFPALVGERVLAGSHMHIMPWSYPQLYLYFKLAGFTPPVIISEPLSKPKHIHERFFAIPSIIYCNGKIRKSQTQEERLFWETAKTDGSLLGRHLMVVGEKVESGK
jgi:SAM-dependent methyltransferase